MLFTNKTLEFSTNRRGEKILELSTLYNNCISLSVDRDLNKEIKYVGNKFHKHLSLKEFVRGKFRLVNEDDSDIYIILDTLEYKVFTRSSEVNYSKEDFGLVRRFNMSNRNNNVSWDIMILKVRNPKSNKLSILEYTNTAGEKKYIVIKDGRLHHYNRYTFMEKYGEEYKEVCNG